MKPDLRISVKEHRRGKNLKVFCDFVSETSQNVVADKQVIADALLRFERVVKSLPPDDQKELVQLIIREISVKYSDPSPDPALRETGTFSTKIRTKYPG